MFVAIVTLIHLGQRKYNDRESRNCGDWQPVPLATVQTLWPEAAELLPVELATDRRDVVDAAGARLGFVLQTSPQGDAAIGFSGPTNLLIGCDDTQHIRGVVVLSSRDTQEHVSRIRTDPKFLQQFNGRTLSDVAAQSRVDAVSGATLTCDAMAEALARRAGGAPTSLKFAEAVSVTDVRVLFPNAAEVLPDRGEPSMTRVHDAAGMPLGWTLRTAPAADNIVGYQGPTDTLIGFDPAGKIVGIAIRGSFDNQPYVGYVRDDREFRALLNGKSLEEILGMDLSEVEGVSAATMTSQAVARGIAAAIDRHLANHKDENKPANAPANAPASVRQPASSNISANISASDYGAAMLILLGLLIGFTNLRGQPWARIIFPLVVLIDLGLYSGTLLSQAQLVGWAQAGLPRGAAGLLLLTLAAFIAPIVSKRNIYCSHLCPHGAAQHVIHRLIRPRFHLSGNVKKLAKLIAPILLVVSVTVAITHWRLSLVDIEPFDAYVFRVAGWSTIAIAVLGLLTSGFVPLAYCRYGCPTGAMLEYLRRNARSDRWTRRDWFAAALLALAAALYVAA